MKLYKACPILLVAGLLVSCDTPQKRGLRELSKRGIEPSGQALLQAVSEHDTQRAGWLIDVGVHTEQCDANGKTPMRIALENHDISSVFKLLDAKANVNASTADHVSVLGIAVELGETAIVEKLLTAGARTDGLMPDGEKILPWAIREGRLTFVRAMMKSGADPHLKDRIGNPLLHVAMEVKRRDLVDALIELGADPGATNAAGETTIQMAFRNGWLDAVPKLAAAGADPNAAGVDGFTLLDRAISSGNTGQVALLLKVGADPNHRYSTGNSPTPLERAFRESSPEMFQVFLDHGAKPPGGVWDEWLWKAFENRNHETAGILLAHGARATSRNAEALGVVEAAALAGDATLVKMLTDYGHPVGNALYHSAARGDLEMVSLLVACGAPVNVTRIPSLDTPLAAAIRRKQDKVAAFLLENGADMDLRLPEGQTPLHLAIATGCHLTVKALLDAGIDPNTPFELPVSNSFLKSVRPGVLRWVLKYDRNVTPLMLAADAGVIQSARYLMRAGAKSEVRTRATDIWPINFASRRNDVKMMRLFLGRDPLHEERRIEIRLSEQRAHVFDSVGNEIFTTKVSTGKKGHDTPTGEYVITNKYPAWKSTLYHASMPYFQRLSCGDFGLHQGNVPDYPASHGCIRVPEGNAQKLFTMTQSGDRVNIIP
ncbi:MAG: ankyrin repeat domain-containing protein [Luteolibacter sp.]|uniref:ankyrin repeat domain-containing protein n=1 Tax=Luteolibacter sp. TaxID=1962973 RepID=UPI003264B3F4